MRLGAATSSVLRSGKFQDSATASGRRSVYPLPDCLVCWVPRLLSVEAALDPNEDFNHCQDSSLCFLSVCPLSVCLSSVCLPVCLSVFSLCLLDCVCSSVHLRSSFVCLPSTVRHIVICLISVCDEGAVVRLAARRGTQHPLLGGEVHVSQWTQHPLMGGEVLVAPRVGRAAVYAEAVRSPTVLCPSVRPLYCAHSVLRSVHLPGCLPVCLLVSRAGGAG